MYSSIYRFSRKYLLRGHQEIRRCLKELERSQWLSREVLEKIQLKKIQRLVTYAFENVPFYRERYRREGIYPQDIKSLKDFQSLPFLTRADVQNHREDLVSRVYRGGVSEGRTSGSTGEPMRFIMDTPAAYWSYAFETRCRGWYGVRRGDKMAWITVPGVREYSDWPLKDRLAANIKRYRYLNPRMMDESRMLDFLKLLTKWRPTMIRAYPSALSVFADFLKKRNMKGIDLRLIECTGEKLTTSQKQLFEEVFQAPVVDHYSALEIFSYAYQCPEGRLHVSEERYIELIENGQVVDDGKTGEVAVTALNQYAMPFIRYKNGDVGIYQSSVCSCGRGMPVLQEILGRKTDLLVKPNGNSVHWAIVYFIIMSNLQEVHSYQAYQPDRNHLEIRLVSSEKIDPARLENTRNEIQPIFGDEMNISVIQVDSIEPSKAGKRHFIISDIKPDSL